MIRQLNSGKVRCGPMSSNLKLLVRDEGYQLGDQLKMD